MTIAASPGSDAAVLAEIDNLAGWLDSRWSIPGTSWRFGLDAVIGLVPGIGDALTTLLSLYIVALGVRAGASPGTLVRMLANVALDALVGAVPLIGDIADVAFKANRRNLALLREDFAHRGVFAP
jgi:hypothetical protein